MKSIRIAGAGLAGLSLGVALRKEGLPVEIHEASSFPRHRVCGEFLSGVSEETLDLLGIRPSLDDAELLTTTSWYDQKGRMLKANLPTPARGISRHLLDARLAEVFEDLGGVLKLGERFPASEMLEEGVVRATGRTVEKGSEWLGLKAHWKDFELESDLEMHLGDDGYIGLSRVEDGRVNVAGLFKRRAGLKAKAAEALVSYVAECGLVDLAKRMREGVLDESSCVGVSSFRFGLKEKTVQSGFRIGDQLAIIPPFTGNGMSMALQSAEMALPVLLKYGRDELSWSAACASYEERCRKRFTGRLRSAKFLHPLLFSSFGQGVAAGFTRSGLLPFSLLYRAVR